MRSLLHGSSRFRGSKKGLKNGPSKMDHNCDLNFYIIKLGHSLYFFFFFKLNIGFIFRNPIQRWKGREISETSLWSLISWFQIMIDWFLSKVMRFPSHLLLVIKSRKKKNGSNMMEHFSFHLFLQEMCENNTNFWQMI